MTQLNDQQRERIIDAVETAIEKSKENSLGYACVGTMAVVGEPNDELILTINIQTMTQYDIDWIESPEYGRH